MNLIKSIKNYWQKALNEINDEEVIDWMVSRQGKITSRELAALSGLSRNQAIIKLNAMCVKHMIEIDYQHYDEGWNNYYKITHQTMLTKLNDKPLKKSKSRISDGEVIHLAMQNNNFMTATLLCAKTDLNYEECQDKLEELYMKNVFELLVSDNGTIRYVLRETEQ